MRFLKSANRTGAAIKVRILLWVALIAAASGFARADDFGPRGDVRELHFAAQRLLAHTARRYKVDPAAVRISDVVAVKDAALLSWDIGTSHGVMGLIRQYDRWWDAMDIYLVGSCWDAATTAYPLSGTVRQWDSDPTPASLLSYGLPAELVSAAAAHNGDVRSHLSAAAPIRVGPNVLVRPRCFTAYYHFQAIQQLEAAGASLDSFRSDTSGYEIAVRYAENNARNAFFHIPYARPPTQAEIIPYRTTLRFISTSVLYFDLTIDGDKPVTFAPGTTIDIWFPFVLDDTLNYDLTIGFAREPIGPVYAKPFDNVLHYKLPGFTVTPGQTLMAEIDGNWP